MWFTHTIKIGLHASSRKLFQKLKNVANENHIAISSDIHLWCSYWQSSSLPTQAWHMHERDYVQSLSAPKLVDTIHTETPVGDWPWPLFLLHSCIHFHTLSSASFPMHRCKKLPKRQDCEDSEPVDIWGKSITKNCKGKTTTGTLCLTVAVATIVPKWGSDVFSMARAKNAILYAFLSFCSINNSFALTYCFVFRYIVTNEFRIAVDSWNENAISSNLTASSLSPFPINEYPYSAMVAAIEQFS